MSYPVSQRDHGLECTGMAAGLGPGFGWWVNHAGDCRYRPPESYLAAPASLYLSPLIMPAQWRLP